MPSDDATSTSVPTRRKKPWYRARNILLALSVAGAVWIGFGFWSALTARPKVRVDYSKKVLGLGTSAQAHATTENGWPVLLDTLHQWEAMTLALLDRGLNIGSGANYLDFDTASVGPYDPDRWFREEMAIDALIELGVFELTASLTDYDLFIKPLPEGQMMVMILLPELGQSRQLVKAQMYRARRALDTGDADTALAAFEESLALSRAIGYQPILINYLVYVACDALINRHMQYAALSETLSEMQCTAMVDMLREREGPTVAMALNGERFSFCDTVQRIYTDNGRGDGRLILSEMQGIMGAWGMGMGTFLGPVSQHPIANVASIAFASRKETMELYDTYIDDLIARGEMTLVERASQPAATNVEMLPNRHLVLKSLMPALDRTVDQKSIYLLGRRGTRIVCALAAYHARHVTYPDTLDALVPEFLDAIPSDPITGGEFMYRRLDERDGDGRPYLLYSFGEDNDDDDGVASDGRWSHHNADGDRLIGMPRPPVPDDYVDDRDPPNGDAGDDE